MGEELTRKSPDNFLLRFVPLGNRPMLPVVRDRRSTVVVPAEDKSGTTFYFDLSALEPNTFGQSSASAEALLYQPW